MEDIQKELEKRDRYRRAVERTRTPAERLRQFWKMRSRMAEMQKLWPEGYERFWRRNIRKRAISWRPE